MQNSPSAPRVGALIDPTRPDPPPSSAVLLDDRGQVLRRTTRHTFTRGRLVRLGPDGRPDLELGELEVSGGAWTTVEAGDPRDRAPLPWPPPGPAEVTFPVTRVDPALYRLVTGGLVLPAGVGR